MDNTKPLFSVIVPVYGVELYIRQCIDSILCQTFSDFELILVDDGSMDSCPEICDEYAKQDPRIHVIHKENGGLVTARQSGAALARGRYVACVDGDDWMSPGYLMDFAKEIEATGADIVCCGSVWWTSSTHEVKKVFPLKARLYEKSEIEKIIFPYLIEDASGAYFPNNLWAKVFTIQTYRQQQLSVNPSIKIAEDSVCVKPCVYHAEKIAVTDLLGEFDNIKSLTEYEFRFAHDPDGLSELEYNLVENFNRHAAHALFFRHKGCHCGQRP